MLSASGSSSWLPASAAATTLTRIGCRVVRLLVTGRCLTCRGVFDVCGVYGASDVNFHVVHVDYPVAIKPVITLQKLDKAAEVGVRHPAVVSGGGAVEPNPIAA